MGELSGPGRSHAGLFVDRPKTPEPRTFKGKTQKADRFCFAPGRIKPNPSKLF
jgi:hypothetical protein